MPQDRQRGMRSGRAGTLAVSLALAGLLVTIGVGGGIAMAQEDMATPVVSGMALGVPTVSVSGHGSVNVPPDTASVSIGVDIIKPTLGEAQEQATTQATAVIGCFEGGGDRRGRYPDRLLQREHPARLLRKRRPDPDHRVRDRQPAAVTVHDTDQLGELLDAAVNAGANSIYGVTFYVDDQTAASSDARVEAVKDARTKAEELAAAAGMTLGPVVAISEGTSPLISPVYDMARGGGMGAGRRPRRSSLARRPSPST